MLALKNLVGVLTLMVARPIGEGNAVQFAGYYNRGMCTCRIIISECRLKWQMLPLCLKAPSSFLGGLHKYARRPLV